MAIRKAELQAQENKKRGEEAIDFESSLPNNELKALDTMFYQRYKLKLEVQVAPSDSLVSSLAKQLEGACCKCSLFSRSRH